MPQPLARGAVYGDQEVGGRWTTLESTSHINILELQAAFFALKSFCKETINGHVQLQIDNSTAVAYIHNMEGGGTSKSPKLNSLA